MSAKSFGNLESAKCALFLCDMQEKFRPAIKYFDEILKIAKRLVDTSKLLELPLIVTEQYPKGLGKTVAELDVSHGTVFEKTKFSMVLPEVEEKMNLLCDGGVKQVILFGIEAHVCIQQTAIDLLTRGIEVFIVADATSSRFQSDRMLAFERLRQAGAVITTCESVMFQLIGDKNHPKFKEVQALVKGDYVDTGLMNKL